MAIIPYLQAEEDVRAHANYLVRKACMTVQALAQLRCTRIPCVTSQAHLEEESRVMKGVKGWKVGESVYNNTKMWMPPTPINQPRYTW